MNTRLQPISTVSESISPLRPVTGAELLVPVVGGGTTRYVNLDYAASAPALESVCHRLQGFLPYYSSVHRGAGFASQVSTRAYESSRQLIGRFVGARTSDVVVITRNTTDSLNLLAKAVPTGTRVLHLAGEHHANLLPWRNGGHLCLPIGATLAQTLGDIEDALAEAAAGQGAPISLLAITGASNVTGEVPPIGRLVELAHRYGARILVDGAQLVPHRRVDLAASGIDYLALSGHKMYAPFGAGALIGAADWLNEAPPHLAGGGAVSQVTEEQVNWSPAPQRHEGGTPNILGAIALAAACEALAEIDKEALVEHERALLERLTAGIESLPGAQVLRIWPDSQDRVAVVSFTLAGQDPALVAAYLSAEHGIGLRDGKFCAHPLLAHLVPGQTGGQSQTALRASVGLGSRSEDIDLLIAALERYLVEGPTLTYRQVNGRPAPVLEDRWERLGDQAGVEGALDAGTGSGTPSLGWSCGN